MSCVVNFNFVTWYHLIALPIFLSICLSICLTLFYTGYLFLHPILYEKGEEEECNFLSRACRKKIFFTMLD